MKKTNFGKMAKTAAKAVGIGLLCAVALGGICIVTGINEIFGEKYGQELTELFMRRGKRALKMDK